MNIELFNEIYSSFDKLKFGQEPTEWKMFMEFIYGYFNAKKIERPMIVEIGCWNDFQKLFYVPMLHADHISIDLKNAMIKGDSHSNEVYNSLVKRLNGKKIDLLFIDGDHTYEGVKKDYEMYAPLTKYIIAIHDIKTTQIPGEQIPVDVKRFWDELVLTNKEDTIMTIHHPNTPESGLFESGRQMGIGLILK